MDSSNTETVSSGTIEAAEGTPDGQNQAPPNTQPPATTSAAATSSALAATSSADPPRPLPATTHTNASNVSSMSPSPRPPQHPINSAAPSGPNRAPSLQNAPPITRPPGSQPPPTAGNAARPPLPAPAPIPISAEELLRRRVANIGTLDELSGKILSLLGKMTTEHAMGISSDLHLLRSGQQPYSPAPAVYQQLRAAFDPLRGLYANGPVFSDVTTLGLKEKSHIETVRKANQAVFCSAVFAGGIGQLALDQGFLDVFVPLGGKLLRRHAMIWLELKTQGFLTAMRMKAAPPDQVMHDLFPSGIANRIIARRPGSTNLHPSEQEFMQNFETRKAQLQDHVNRKALPELDAVYPYSILGEVTTRYLIKTHVKPWDEPGLAQPVPDVFKPTKEKWLEDPENQKAVAAATDIPDDDFDDILDAAFKEAMIGTALEVPGSREPDSEDEFLAPRPTIGPNAKAPRVRESEEDATKTDAGGATQVSGDATVKVEETNGASINETLASSSGQEKPTTNAGAAQDSQHDQTNAKQ